MCKKVWLLIWVFLFLASCTTKVDDVILSPSPHEINSPDKISDSLAREQIYWQGRFIHLDGTPVVNVPDAEAIEKLSLYSYPKLSHNNRYLAYQCGIFNRIGLWDLESNERKELVNASESLPYDATIGGFAFTPDDEKILFSLTWHGEDKTVYADLATVDITTGQIERLDITDLQVAFNDLDISSDGKWVVLDMVSLNNNVCLLVNLERRYVDCLSIEEGWYLSAKFMPDNTHIVYSHNKKIDSPSSIMLSRIDGTQTQELVSGFVKAIWIQLVTNNEIVFVGTAYPDSPCSYVYVINQDGSDLRKLSYLGGQCKK